MEPTDDLNPQGNEGQGTAAFEIPEEYADHPALQGIHDMDGLVKKVVNQEALIGKKYIGIPDSNSTPEEVAKYREAIGVPVTFKDYDLQIAPEIKEAFGDDDETMLNDFKQLMFDAGLSQNQAQQMRTGYDKIMGGIVQQRRDEQAALDNEFEQLINTAFGDKKEEKLRIAESFIKENVSDSVKPYLPNVLNDNKALMVIADMANNIYPNMKEDDLRKTPGGLPAGATSPEAVKAEMQKIIASPAFQDPRNLGHDKAVQDLQDQAALLDRLNGKA